MKNIHTKVLMYSGALFLLILSILSIATTVFVVNDNNSYDENTISVTGTAEVSSAPDIANFSFTVQETAKESAQAQEIINQKVQNILDGLDDLGVDEKDIKTESYTIYPKYEWVRELDESVKMAVSGESYIVDNGKKNVQVGFDVSQNVSVTVRDLETVPSILTLFTDNDVENLNGPRFEIDDPEGLREEARLQAIIQAKEKAKRLASDLDVRLGKIVSFYENSSNPEPYYGDMMAKSVSFNAVGESSAPELPAGENDISATVTIIYSIK